MERYEGVLGRKRVERISAALEASETTILAAPSPSVAPFQYRVRTSQGETLRLTCYAFTANKYEQEGRPSGEHRFQVKYGSDFHRPHTLHLDQSDTGVTLMFGVHDSWPLFVAVDPAMHSPTWFSSSVEFKEADLRKARATGWHGWQRERVSSGRRRAHPPFDTRTEVLVAFRPEHFGTYVLFERVARGLDAGERLLLIDRIGKLMEQGQSPMSLLVVPRKARVKDLAQHPLLVQLGLEPEELLDVLSGRFRLLSAVRGGVAEHHLERVLRATNGITKVERFDRDGQPDFVVEFKRQQFRVECKNVMRRKVRNLPKVDFQKTRAARGNPCSRYYSADQFEVLAACMHPITEHWEYLFCSTNSLKAHPTCPGRLHESVAVDGDIWQPSLVPLLRQLST